MSASQGGKVGGSRWLSTDGRSYMTYASLVELGNRVGPFTFISVIDTMGGRRFGTRSRPFSSSRQASHIHEEIILHEQDSPGQSTEVGESFREGYSSLFLEVTSDASSAFPSTKRDLA
jgi:hypothetical protein